MARMFVYSDNLSARVELRVDDESGDYVAFCSGCSRGDVEPRDLLFNERAWTAEDVQQFAAIHVDCCKRCADPECLTSGVHDEGRRCRKPYSE